MSKKDIIDELNTISVDLILKQNDAFTAWTISRAVEELTQLRARVVELEHWFHDYRTPELSMAEMFKQLKAAEAKLAEAHSDYARWKADWVSVSKHGDARLEAAESTLARVKDLIPKWKEGDFDLPDYTRGKMDGRHECVKQLKSVLDKAGN